MPALLPTFEPLIGPYLHLTPMTEADLPELATLLSDPRQHEAGMIMYACPTTPEQGTRQKTRPILRQECPFPLHSGKRSGTDKWQDK